MQRLLPLVLASVFTSTHAIASPLEEITVHGSRKAVVLDKSNLSVAMPDAAELMRRVPGGSVNKNGALSGIPQYRGMYGTRVHVQINGLAISPGGPNWMDPPLHYAPAALLEQFTVYRGIAPVSAGEETIGGAVSASTWQGEHGNSTEWQTQGRFYSGGQSNNAGWVTALSAALANDRHKLHTALLREAGDNQESVNATLLPSEYKRERYDLGYSLLLGDHELSIDSQTNRTDDSGTPALPMDILYVDGDSQQVRWRYQAGSWKMAAHVATGNIEHGMTNFHLRQPPTNIAKWRRNETSSDTESTSIHVGQTLSVLSWEAGIDYRRSVHNSAISNPNNAVFYVVNFNDIQRELTGFFTETQINATQNLELNVGLRVTRAETDADRVATSMAVMNPMAAALRDRFNNAERRQRDTLYDTTAKLHFAATDTLTLYTGLARKSRAPAYQERYLWLPMQSTAGLADGNNHVGTVDLRPEVSHEMEIGFDINDEQLMVSPRLFWKQVDNYIQGIPSTDAEIIMVSTMMGGDATPLRFENTSAKLYGGDFEGSWRFLEKWTLGAVISITRGERRDIDDNLYRIAPDRLTLSLQYQTENWSASLITAGHRHQNRVSTTNEELETPGYGLLHLHSNIRLAEGITLAIGANNLLDKSYADHLGGYNRAVNPDIAFGERLPGIGRDIFARLRWDW